ncbi:MAG TPA: autotransporter outer membrane beta-barrel domain-containing protein [Rhodanobacteraceae bacterium]|nr:autotransporter outer membrane beta-barrel domain-containing protein [Rhodanobacteraceae bacterium]
MNGGRHMRSGPGLLRVLLATGLAVAAADATAATSQLVVVHKGGHASAFALRNHALQSTAAVCEGDDVVFAFVVAPADGVDNLQLRRGVDTGADIHLELTVTCSNITGRAVIPFDAGGGTAVRGSDYSSTGGAAMLPLAVEGSGSAGATVSVQVLDGAGTSGGDVTFDILRRDGSFQGQGASGTPIVGVVPGSSSPIVVVTILAGTTIDEAADIVDGLDLAAREVSAAVDEFCRIGSGGGSDSPGCEATRRAADLIGNPATPADVRDAAITVLENNLRAISPDETTGLAFNARELALRQHDNLASRLSALHSRTTSGASLEGLTLVSNGMPLSLDGLADGLEAGDDDADSNQANEEKRTLLGGTRWGFWLNGTLGGSDRDRVAGNAGFDSHTWSLTSGIDYRFNSHFFLGAAIGYSSFDSDFSNDQGALNADARSLHAYGGYTSDSGLALDGSLSYARSDYDLERVVELFQLTPDGTGYTSLGRDLAVGHPEVRQLSASIGLTYTIMRETWTFAPQAQLLYLQTNYDAFSENGPSDFNLAYPERESDGHSLSAGIYIDRTWATTVGAFRPYTRLLYYADSGGSPPDLLSNFLTPNADGSQTNLRLAMAEPDQRYGTVEFGLGFSRPIGSRTVDFNFGGMELFDSSDLRRWAVRMDVRVPF